MNSFADIIAAVSTPPGKGGVAIIRISGNGALALSAKAFFPASKKELSAHSPRTQVYGYVISETGKKIDDGLACYFPEGSSFTGEETVEISSHGGILVTSMVLERMLECGARMAEAGEFTRRAFINGRLSLTEAEAIGELLEAQSREQVALASADSRALLKLRIEEIKNLLIETLSSVYARIDYPDENLGELSDGEIEKRLGAAYGMTRALLDTYKTGKAIMDGVKTVICGKPNAGKSSVYNMILGEDAAIVTDVKGTTTDVLTHTAKMNRVTLRLCDTAGIRSDADAGVIERIGIERTLLAMKDAELIIAVFDLSGEFSKEDEDVLNQLDGIACAKIALLNKADSEHMLFDESKISGKFDTVLRISAKSPEESLPALSDAVNRMFTDERIKCGESAIISSARQHAILKSALVSLVSARDALHLGCTADMVSSDIERALRFIAEADGREVSEAVTSDIFSKFCVGK